jgi:hypothetical protein
MGTAPTMEAMSRDSFRLTNLFSQTILLSFVWAVCFIDYNVTGNSCGFPGRREIR